MPCNTMPHKGDVVGPAPVAPDRMIIAVDPHKASWTAVTVDGRQQPVAAVRVEVNREGYRQLRRFARRWPNACWARTPGSP